VAGFETSIGGIVGAQCQSSENYRPVKLCFGIFFALLSMILCQTVAYPNGFVVPKYAGPVTDTAKMLDATTSINLANQLDGLYRAGGSQIAVLTVETLGGVSVEQAAIMVFDSWKLGDAERDNGVLLLISKVDRRLRVEVGRGLEGTLTDLYAKRIIDQSIVPRFRESNMTSGVVDGVSKILSYTDPSFRLSSSQFGPSSTQSSNARAVLAKTTVSKETGEFAGLFVVWLMLFVTVIAASGSLSKAQAWGWGIFTFLLTLGWHAWPSDSANHRAGTCGLFVLGLAFVWKYLPFPKPMVDFGRSLKDRVRSVAADLGSSLSGESGGFSDGGGGDSGGGGASGDW
jgi:uncharacterized protein